MYENYTKQALPSRYYRELLGTAQCVFPSNSAFVIENILRLDLKHRYSWHSLIDEASGRLSDPIIIHNNPSNQQRNRRALFRDHLEEEQN